MTSKERNHIKLLFKEESIQEHKNWILNLFDNYDNKSKNNQNIVFDKLTAFVLKMKFSRRKLYGLIDELTSDMTNSGKFSPELLDELENYLDSLSGNCSWKNILKLYKDPEDQLALSNYVRSKEWIYKEFYGESA